MSHGHRKEITQLIRKLRKDGFDVEQTKGGHWAVRKGELGPIYMPQTPSDYRSIRAVRSKLKHIGFPKDR